MRYFFWIGQFRRKEAEGYRSHLQDFMGTQITRILAGENGFSIYPQSLPVPTRLKQCHPRSYPCSISFQGHKLSAN